MLFVGPTRLQSIKSPGELGFKSKSQVPEILGLQVHHQVQVLVPDLRLVKSKSKSRWISVILRFWFKNIEQMLKLAVKLYNIPGNSIIYTLKY